jgi:hypothetical protein
MNFAFATQPFEKENGTVQFNTQKSEVFASNVSTTKYNLLVNGSEKCPKFQKLKKTGLILMCVGAPLAGVGIGLIAAGTALTINNEDVNFIPMIAVGYVSTVAGIAMTGAGVPLYIIGNIKSKKYCGGTSFQLNQSRNGIGLAYNF